MQNALLVVQSTKMGPSMHACLSGHLWIQGWALVCSSSTCTRPTARMCVEMTSSLETMPSPHQSGSSCRCTSVSMTWVRPTSAALFFLAHMCALVCTHLSPDGCSGGCYLATCGMWGARRVGGGGRVEKTGCAYGLMSNLDKYQL
jgi:hypothetical protein